MSDTKKPVTLKEIAREAQTSIGTVDRALNNRAGISPKRRQEILAIAQRMGYKPNRFASGLRKSRSLRIGIAYPIITQAFYEYVDAGVNAIAEELRDYGVDVEKIRYEAQDPELAYAALSQLDASRYDGLAVNAAGGRAAEIIDRFMEAGVPVITFNSDATDSNRLFYVGGNARETGMMGGELMALLLGGQGNVTVVGNFARGSAFVERFGGFCAYLQPAFPDIQIFPCSEYHNYAEQAAESLMALLKRIPEINGIFCTGHTSTIGAVNALKSMDRKDITLIGFDVSDQTISAMEENWCTALLYQDPYRQGYMAVKLLAKHLLEGWLPEKKQLHIESRIVLRSNMRAYTNPSAFLDASL